MPEHTAPRLPVIGSVHMTFLTKTVRWQPPMVKVLLGLIPVIASSVYFFGWRALAMLAVVNAAAWGVV